MSFKALRWLNPDKLVSGLLYASLVNCFVVYFTQGGYDIRLGPIHLHAYLPRNWLLLCLGLALLKPLMKTRHVAAVVAEWMRSALLLFLIVISAYYGLHNGVLHETGDTMPARLLPFSLIRELDFDLNEFRVLDNYRDQYFVARYQDHVIPAYPPWVGVLATPVYAIPVLRGASADDVMTVNDLERRAAALITAASVLVLFFTLRRLTRLNTAWLVSIVYAFGTSSFSTSSQALWQHGPSQLFLTLTLYCLVRGLQEPRFDTYAIAALGFAVLVRPLNLVMALPIVLYVLLARRRRLTGVLLAASGPLLVFMVYNTLHFGSPFTTGFGGTVVTPSSLVGTHLSWFNTPILEGIAGILVSPSRGLLVYSPILVFAFAEMARSWSRANAWLLKYLSVAPLLLLIPVATVGKWWGGWGYGPRLLTDATPILCLFLYPVFEQAGRRGWLKWTLGGLAALSIMLHAIGAYNDFSWNNDPVHIDYDPKKLERLWSWTNSPPVYYLKKWLLTSP